MCIRDRRAHIVSDNRARRILYLVYGAIAVAAVCLLGGFATIVLVLGLGPVLLLIVVIEIYSRIQNWRRLRAAEDADAKLDKLRPEKSTEALPVNVIHKLRGRAQQAQNAGEPYLAADLRPVSYTHLDVYKRQDTDHANSGAAHAGAHLRTVKR